MKRLQIVHPFLFAALPILGIYAAQPGLVTPTAMLGPILVVLSVSGAVLALLTLATNLGKAAVITSLWAVNALTYYVAFESTSGFTESLGPGVTRMVFLALWLSWPVLLTVFVLRSRVDWIRINAIINVVAIVLFFGVAGKIVSIEFSRPPSAALYPRDAALRASVTPAETGLEPDPNGPRDIYYLIFDRYANVHTLENTYGFDNSPFLKVLTDHGFYVANESHSNYSNTAQSLSSSFNLEHIDYLRDIVGADSTDYAPLNLRLRDHHVLRFLRARGYRFFQLGNWWEPTRTNPFADAVFVQYHLAEFSRSVLKASFLPAVGEFLGIRSLTEFEHDCDQLWNQFDDLIRAKDEPGPKFVFSHFILPHPPYIFDKEGRCLAPNDIRQRDDREGYVSQLIFANTLIEQFLDGLQRGGPDDPIILIQADEGPYPRGIRDWESATPAQVREKFAILNAYYLPGVDPTGVLYPTVTPVNSFRILFNTYFGTKYEMLEDRAYAHRNDAFFGFSDVSDFVTSRAGDGEQSP